MDDPEDITAWQRIDGEVTTSGRIVATDVARLAALGVRHVINLALLDGEGALADEAAQMTEAGLAYSHVPVPFDAPDDTHFAAFVAAYNAAARPLHVHCIANMRVSAFLYRYHRDHLGMAEADARALMERVWSPDSGQDPLLPAAMLEPWAKFIAAGQ
jgi:uncharacterized protein (TIGR01244 family)